MKRKAIHILAPALLLVPLLAACGTPTTAQQAQPTPTPLPPASALERPIYTVERGDIDRVLEVNGRVTPIDLVRLAFRRTGRVARVNVARGDTVKAGDILAELEQDDKLDALRDAEDGLVQAQRDVQSARDQQAQRIQEAALDLRDAREDLAQLLPGGANDPIRKAQDELEDAQRRAQQDGAAASEEKTNAEHQVLLKAEALEDAQAAYSSAWWNNDWVERYGTHPTEQVTDPRTGKQRNRELSDQEREAFKTALVKAERDLREAERALELAQREAEQQNTTEGIKNDDLAEDVQEKQEALDRLLQGRGNDQLRDAQRNVERKRLALAEAQETTFNTEIKKVEDAQRALEKARAEVADGQVIAPQDGQVLSIAIGEGDSAEEFDPVVEIADPTRLEVAAELSAEQMRELSEGQPAEISLLSRPDVVMPATIRQLPAGYGSGASGAVAEQDRRTRFTVTDTKGQEFTSGAVVQIQIVLEHKEDVLWLPPEAIRSFEGRRFVEVREGNRTRRAPVQIGIETDGQVEILDGLEVGDMVIGQ